MRTWVRYYTNLLLLSTQVRRRWEWQHPRTRWSLRGSCRKPASKEYTYGRHLNKSIININQNLLYKGKFSRAISLNATCFILVKQRDIGQLEILDRQIFEGKRAKEFLEIYRKVCLEHLHEYICVGKGPRAPDSINLRSNTIREEPCEIVYQWRRIIKSSS